MDIPIKLIRLHSNWRKIFYIDKRAGILHFRENLMFWERKNIIFQDIVIEVIIVKEDTEISIIFLVNDKLVFKFLIYFIKYIGQIILIKRFITKVIEYIKRM